MLHFLFSSCSSWAAGRNTCGWTCRGTLVQPHTQSVQSLGKLTASAPAQWQSHCTSWSRHHIPQLSCHPAGKQMPQLPVHTSPPASGSLHHDGVCRGALDPDLCILGCASPCQRVGAPCSESLCNLHARLIPLYPGGALSACLATLDQLLSGPPFKLLCHLVGCNHTSPEIWNPNLGKEANYQVCPSFRTLP